MSSLTDVENRYFEKLFGMQTGYVLDFSDATYGEFFARHKINIHGAKYQTYGTSKAKKTRAFWEQEPDSVVARVLSELLDSYQADCDLGDQDVDSSILGKCRATVSKLSGKPQAKPQETVESFLHKEFATPNIHKLQIEPQVAVIIEARLDEARKAMGAGAYLSVIFLCGSVLEGVLLGTAQQTPKKFITSTSSPKDAQGKVKPFYDWSLASLINVACDINLLKHDVKKFSHGLRDFRNYVHPYQ